MAGTIGTQTFDLIAGAEPPPKLNLVVEELERPGIDGTQVSTVGKRGAPFTWARCIIWRSGDTGWADCLQFYNELRALEGRLVSITDVQGNTTHNVLVRRVSAQGPRAVFRDGALAAQMIFSVEMRMVAEEE